MAEDQDGKATGSSNRRVHGAEAHEAVLRRPRPRVREDKTWRYIGHVGTGFSHRVLEDLHAKLIKLTVSKSPFPAKVKDEAVTTWVRPSLVAEVKFAEWTGKGELRQPVYLGLRSDKRAKDVVRERERPRK